jgi:hypothetical protein
MKLILKSACLFILTLCASSHVALAQTNAATIPKTNSTPRMTKRFDGKIATLDKQAKTFTTETATNEVTLINAQTRILKDRKPATFEDLAVGQTVTGSKHPDASGAWVAISVSVAIPKPSTNDPKAQ